MVSSIAIYGSFHNKVEFSQRFWKKRKDGIRQRYWKKIQRKTKPESKGRYEFSGRGKDLYKAIVKAHEVMPKGYVSVEAKKFVEKPEKYGKRGVWIDKEIQSG